MIDETFVHCSGIGPKTDIRLKNLGFKNWKDCIDMQNELPFKEEKRKQFIKDLKKSRSALEANNIALLVEKFPVKEHWRILGEYYPEATYFDIETTGLSSYDSLITVIVCYKDNQLHTFLFQENLDDFLSLVEESSLLVAFNGNSFDIPFIENSFNIPEIGCPYIDLRWICYHAGYSGGLKTIEKELFVTRPEDIKSIDGFEAVSLFLDWQNGNSLAKEKLVKYCQADVLSSYLVAIRLLDQFGICTPKLSHESVFKKLNR